MFQYRQVLLRLRQGDSDRDVARSGLCRASIRVTTRDNQDDKFLMG